MSGVATGAVAPRRRALGAASLFVLGFAVVFTGLGATASLLGAFLARRLPVFVRIAGVFVLLFGLATLGVLRIPFLDREKRLDLRRIRSGPAGAIPLGMAFAFGWTPCIGPVLGAVLTVAAATQAAATGAVLLFVYSFGMGVPFLGLAWACGRAGGSVRWLRRWGRVIERAGGVLLVAMGALLIAGWWQRLFTPLARYLLRLGWPAL